MPTLSNLSARRMHAGESKEIFSKHSVPGGVMGAVTTHRVSLAQRGNLHFKKLLGWGGLGIAALYEVRDGAGQRRCNVVVKCNIDPSADAGDLAGEKQNHRLMARAHHVIQTVRVEPADGSRKRGWSHDGDADDDDGYDDGGGGGGKRQRSESSYVPKAAAGGMVGRGRGKSGKRPQVLADALDNMAKHGAKVAKKIREHVGVPAKMAAKNMLVATKKRREAIAEGEKPEPPPPSPSPPPPPPSEPDINDDDRILIIEVMARGNLDMWIKKMSSSGKYFTNKVLWMMLDCCELLRGLICCICLY